MTTATKKPARSVTTKALTLTAPERRLLARKYNIENARDFARAQDTLIHLKRAKAGLKKRADDIKRPLNDARAAVLALEKDLYGVLDARIQELTEAIATWRYREQALTAPPPTPMALPPAEDLSPAEAAILSQVATELEATPEPAAPPPTLGPGLAEVESWKAEVTDLRTFLQSVLDGKAPLECLTVHLPSCHALAEQWKSLLPEMVPGLTSRRDIDYRRTPTKTP